MIGRVVGKYRILDQIGEGGMGVVYRAEHVVLGSPAAIKVLLPRFTLDRTVVERFFTEAKATSAIRHVGIVAVFDYGRLPNDQAYIAMELLRGENFADFVERHGGKLAPPLAAQVAMQMFAALDAAHVVGVVHRDLKPDNLFLVTDPTTPGGVRVKILDFGIAKLVNQRVDKPMTKGGAILGTPAYMAPEQCRGGVPVDARADLYAVGCILFELLVGRPPFVGETSMSVIGMHMNEPPPRLTAMARGMPVELDALLAKLLQKSPADRVPSAAYALAALERITLDPLGKIELRVADRGQGAVSLPAPREPRRWIPYAVLAVAVVIAIVAVVIIGSSGGGLPH